MKSITIPYDSPSEIPDGILCSGVYPDKTAYRLEITQNKARFYLNGTLEAEAEKQNVEGVWSVEKGNGKVYALFIARAGRSPKDAFLYQNNRLILAKPERLSPQNWEKLAGAFHKIGYDSRDGENSRLRFSNLVQAGIWANGQGYFLQPDQQDAIEQLWFQKKKQGPGKKIKEQMEQKAIEIFGSTSVWPHAGYMTKSGVLLNFSHEGRQRDMDHRSAADVLESIPSLSESERENPIRTFLYYGNIRVHPFGIHLMQKPTPEQKKALRALDGISHNICVDIAAPQGCLADTKTFPMGTPSYCILKAIDDYFRTGFF